MIELVTDWDALVNALGAAAMLAFGVWVLTLTPRTRATKLLAVFAMTAGAVWVPRNLLQFSGSALEARWAYDAVLTFLGGLAVLGLTRELLSRYGASARRPWRAAVAVAMLSSAIPVAYVLATWPLLWSLERWVVLWVVSQGGFWFFFGALLALLIILAWMYRSPPAGLEKTTRSQALVISAPLMLWPAYSAGFNTLTTADPMALWDWEVYGLLAFVGFLGLAGFWLANAGVDRSRSTRASKLAVLILSVVLVGMVDPAFLARWIDYPGLGPLWGVARLATVLGLGYGILRHEILGIDAKFRWGLSRTTVAGVFIAVFFVAGEAAETFFGNVFGPYVGIIAAGALVFVISPLQRLSDRFAEKAMPGPSGRDEESIFRRTASKYLADGALSPEEERDLGQLAARLGIDAGRAIELRQQAQGDARGGEEA